MKKNENKELLQNWIDNKLAVANAGDGAWWWTKIGMTTPGIIRMLLSGLLYGKEIPNYQQQPMLDAGFSTDGYVLEE